MQMLRSVLLFRILFVAIAIADVAAFCSPTCARNIALPSSSWGPSDLARRARMSVLFSQEDDSNGSDASLSTDAIAEKYGFDRSQANPSQEQTPPPVSVQQTQSDRLRRSLDESAKFKVRNDARFTWLSTLLVSGVYAYGCLAPDGEDFLGSLGIPSGGILGGVGGVFFSLVSLVLFFAPELFAKRRR